MTTYKEKCTG